MEKKMKRAAMENNNNTEDNTQFQVIEQVH